MIGAMVGMIGNAARMRAGIERVGGRKFMVRDTEVSGLVDRRSLFKTAGAMSA